MSILREWGIKKLTKKNVTEIPDETGVYLLMDSNKFVVYVGMSESLQEQLLNHLESEDIPNIQYFMVYQLSKTLEARNFERDLIYQYQPYYNTQVIHD